MRKNNLNLTRCAQSPTHGDQPAGSVLLIVLVVIVFLSLGAYTFSEMMLIEAQSANLYGRRVQARAFADSGLDYVTSLLDNDLPVGTLNTYNDATLYRDIVVQPGDTPRTQGRFSIIAASEADLTRKSIRFGLMDESGKLNINALSQHSTSTARTMLMGIPGMTDEISDSILDWTDQNDTPGDYGAEEDYYLALPTPYAVKNGPLESLDELLLVKGMTPQLLYGEDADRDGMLDSGEDDGDLSHPPDDANGELDLGFSAYLTVDSREANVQSDGTPRINIASDKLDELYDQLLEEFDEETAKFVVAYRLFGPAVDPSSQRGGGSSGGRTASTSKSMSPGVGTGSSAGADTGQTLQQDVAVGTGQVGGQTGEQGASTGESGGSSPKNGAVSAGKAIFGGQGQVTRGGMELSGGAQFPVRSIFDLVGVSVNAKIDKTQKTLESPWADDPGEMRDYISTLDDTVTTLSEENLAGRININEAPIEVMRGLPEFTEELAYDIISRRKTSLDGQSLSALAQGRDSVGWLYTENVVDLATLRNIAPLLTGGGDVYTTQIMGYFDAGPPLVRIEAVIDATQKPAKVIKVREMTPLGIGYPRDLFTTGE